VVGDQQVKSMASAAGWLNCAAWCNGFILGAARGSHLSSASPASGVTKLNNLTAPSAQTLRGQPAAWLTLPAHQDSGGAGVLHCARRLQFRCGGSLHLANKLGRMRTFYVLLPAGCCAYSGAFSNNGSFCCFYSGTCICSNLNENGVNPTKSNSLLTSRIQLSLQTQGMSNSHAWRMPGFPVQAGHRGELGTLKLVVVIHTGSHVSYTETLINLHQFPAGSRALKGAFCWMHQRNCCGIFCVSQHGGVNRLDAAPQRMRRILRCSGSFPSAR
jgi:hypothetical protein